MDPMLRFRTLIICFNIHNYSHSFFLFFSLILFHSLFHHDVHGATCLPSPTSRNDKRTETRKDKSSKSIGRAAVQPTHCEHRTPVTARVSASTQALKGPQVGAYNRHVCQAAAIKSSMTHQWSPKDNQKPVLPSPPRTVCVAISLSAEATV